jgi:hypothetical protein
MEGPREPAAYPVDYDEHHLVVLGAVGERALQGEQLVDIRRSR